MSFSIRSFIYHWLIIACLAFIIFTNIRMHVEIKKMYQFLGKKIDVLEQSMAVLNADVDDSFLPEISPNELWSKFDIPPLKDIDPNHFVASITSHAEKSVIASIAKISNNMLEIGTGQGGTILMMATYSAPKAQLHSIDLPDDRHKIFYERGDSPILAANALKSQNSPRDYVYKKTSYKNKIDQIFADTKEFNETKFSKQLDFIFIDGAKTYSYMQNDTKKAFNMIKPNGIILWHSYDKASPDVIRFLNELSKKYKIYHVKNTSLVIYVNRS